jgi:putative hydrolases of HD superfamily
MRGGRMNAKLKSQINFLNEIENLKLVNRRNRTIDRSRPENSAEHSWHVALMALVLSEHAHTEIDILRVIKMLLIHDLVEIYSGDTWAYDLESVKTQASREQESARKVFALLPAEQGAAFEQLWKEFEGRQTPESQFAASIDALQPLMNHLISGSHDESLPLPACADVLEKKRHIALSSSSLWEYAQEVITESTRRGLYTKG